MEETQKGEKRGGGTSGWGAAAGLSAIEEGLAGIRDLDVQFRVMEFTPRWVVTDYNELRFFTGYELSQEKIDVYFVREEARLWYRLSAPAREIQCHILLPEGKNCTGVTIDGCGIAFERTAVGTSQYVDFVLRDVQKGRDRFGWTDNCTWEIACEFATGKN